MTAKQWVRVKAPGVHGMRRGAWYAVVGARSGLLIVSVNRRNVPVPTDLVEIRESEPTAWSVVQWDPGDRGAQRVAAVGYSLRYVVCPACRTRAQVGGEQPVDLTCPTCTGAFEVDWSVPC